MENDRQACPVTSVSVLLTKSEIDEIEAEFMRDASTASTTEGLSILAKVRTARGWFV